MKTAYANALQQIRDAHAQLISEGEVVLSFRRQIRGRFGGGYSSWADDPVGGIGPYTCRVAWQGGRPAQVGPDPGLQQRDPSYVLSLPEGAALRPDDLDENMVRIETTHPVLGRFRLRNIKPMIAFSQTIGWQSDLELIK